MADKKLSEVTKVKDMAYVPVILSDGSVGQIAKADLASVVAGVLKTNTLDMSKTNVDLDTLQNTQNYLISSDATNLPVKAWGILSVVGNGNDVTQQFFSYSAWTAWGRTKNANGSWSDWRRFDNFGYNSLAELASGVAEVIKPMAFAGNLEGDANDVGNGFYIVHGGNYQFTNLPSGIDLGLLVSFSAEGGSGGNPKFQIVTKVNQGVLEIHMRAKWSNVWSPWKNL